SRRFPLRNLEFIFNFLPKQAAHFASMTVADHGYNCISCMDLLIERVRDPQCREPACVFEPAQSTFRGHKSAKSDATQADLL
ncbi:hypothetical protein, partial [Bradyrhizobium sp.]|uniref:hypothetical protein n=1 Tax=Bradyrhizobium sp. TaxID=376 RepID=UPI003C206A7F